MDEGFAMFDHTGDLGLEAWAETPVRLFELAALGLMAQIAEPPAAREDGDAELQVRLALVAADPEALLLDWLNAVLLESELGRAIWTRAEIETLEGGTLHARLAGVPRDRSRLTFLFAEEGTGPNERRGLPKETATPDFDLSAGVPDQSSRHARVMN